MWLAQCLIASFHSWTLKTRLNVSICVKKKKSMNIVKVEMVYVVWDEVRWITPCHAAMWQT